MEKPIKRDFYRRAIKVGNSSGVLLPKALLGAEVRVIVINRPLNIKREVIRMLDPFLEEIRGIYILPKITSNKLSKKTETSQEEKIVVEDYTTKPKKNGNEVLLNQINVIAIANQEPQVIEGKNIKLNIIPLSQIKKQIYENRLFAEKIFRAKPILNKPLLLELKKEYLKNKQKRIQ
ncbi:MAG: hypothetical protein QXJ28_00605 [Candidatus Pacearchaeota archaeon]